MRKMKKSILFVSAAALSLSSYSSVFANAEINSQQEEKQIVEDDFNNEGESGEITETMVEPVYQQDSNTNEEESENQLNGGPINDDVQSVPNIEVEKESKFVDEAEEIEQNEQHHEGQENVVDQDQPFLEQISETKDEDQNKVLDDIEKEIPKVEQIVPTTEIIPIQPPLGQVQEVIPEVSETEGVKLFKESDVGQMINLGNISAKKVSDNEAVAELTELISFDSLDTKLQNVKVTLKELLNAEVDVVPMSHSDVVEGEGYVITEMNIPFAYINRDTNTVKLLSQVERLSVKITIY